MSRVYVERVSKHRGGRTPKMTKEQKRKRNRVARIATQARKKLFLEHQADLRALQEALRD